MIMRDQYMMKLFSIITTLTNRLVVKSKLHNFVRGSLNILCKTPLLSLVIRQSIFIMHIHRCCLENSGVYKLYRNAKTDICSFDISTCKLLSVIKLNMKGDFSATLDLVNQVLSNIPPFALFFDDLTIRAGEEALELYVDFFIEENITVFQRARKAWMFNMNFVKDMNDAMPIAIKIELLFCHQSLEVISISPFTCAYYLQFLCYHDTHQFDNRESALQQLIDAVHDVKQCGNFQFTS